MRSAIVLLIVGLSAYHLLAQTTPRPCPSDQNTQANKCFQAYLADYNVNPISWQNFITARIALFNATGRDGFDQSCGWQLTLDSCLQGVDLNSCLTPDSFSNWFGVSQSDSVSFRTWYYIGDYECTDGKAMFDQNWACMVKVQQYEANNLQSCYNTYVQQVTNGSDVCASYNLYITCVDTVYGIICGPSVKPYICQMDEIGFEVNYGGCNKTLQNCF